LKKLGSTRDQLLQFLLENMSEKTFLKTVDEEIYESLWKVQDAKGKKDAIQHLNIEFGKANEKVRLVLRNESTRLVLLKVISTSTRFHLSPTMTSKYWQPTRITTEVLKLNGRPPALDVSISMGNLCGGCLRTKQMVTQLIGGSLMSMQVVFGPWWYDLQPDELGVKLNNHKLMLDGVIPKNDQEFKEFEELMRLTHVVPVQRSRDEYRIWHNKTVCERKPPREPIARLEDRGVITDEMLEDLD
jgi:hypothetical protein